LYLYENRTFSQLREREVPGGKEGATSLKNGIEGDFRRRGKLLHRDPTLKKRGSLNRAAENGGEKKRERGAGSLCWAMKAFQEHGMTKNPNESRKNIPNGDSKTNQKVGGKERIDATNNGEQRR